MGLRRTVAPHLYVSARERKGQMPVRLLLALLLVWGLKGHMPIGVLLGWGAAAVLILALEYWSLTPFRRERPSSDHYPPLWRTRLACFSLFGVATVYALGALAVWFLGGSVAHMIAVLILAGGLVNNIASGIESRALFLLGGGPYLAALAVVPVFQLAAGVSFGDLLLVCAVLLFGAGVLGAWGRVHRVRLAEIAALSEAEARLAQAEAAMADRAAMAAIISHELRTPVSAILAGAQVVRQDEPADSKTAVTADLIIDAGRLMSRMLNELLDHAKIEARGMTLEARDFDLCALIGDVARFWRATAEQKGLTFEVIAESHESRVWLRGDPYRLRQILNNLLSNAIKFTDEGRVVMSGGVVDAEGGRRLVLTVSDQGMGVKPEAMSRLFAPFAQGSAEVARTYGGTGLGLAVSRDLARLMGGDLTVGDNPDGGAAFTLDVVMPRGEPVATDDEEVEAKPSLGRRMRILAVDDHEINRRTLALVLQPLDVDLATASDGVGALKLLAERPFDVVLMDVNMPELDGNEATRRLRASGGLNAFVPVIGFSAGTEAAQIEACRAAGMTDWLAKPLEPRKLYAALENAMKSQTESAVA